MVHKPKVEPRKRLLLLYQKEKVKDAALTMLLFMLPSAEWKPLMVYDCCYGMTILVIQEAACCICFICSLSHELFPFFMVLMEMEKNGVEKKPLQGMKASMQKRLSKVLVAKREK